MSAKPLDEEAIFHAARRIAGPEARAVFIDQACGDNGGPVLLEQKKWTDAEPLLRECLAIREKTRPDAWSTFNTQSMLGGALLGQKQYAEAEPLLLEGYEGMKAREKTIPPQGKVRLTEALDRLIELYTATNQPDEVQKWRAERGKYSAAAPPLPQKK
jgi:eukaryotic-like serine/threonine-protein kinase